MKKRYLIIILLTLLIMGGVVYFIYYAKDVNLNKEKNNFTTENNNNNKKENINMNIKIIIGNNTYTATLEENESSKKFIEMLPIKVNMSELNGNEKYCYLDNVLPTNSYSPKKIYKGDIMLFGSDCLVLFYKTFNTSYNYTKIGKIDNPDGLEKSLGKENVIVRFEK